MHVTAKQNKMHCVEQIRKSFLFTALNVKDQSLLQHWKQVFLWAMDLWASGVADRCHCSQLTRGSSSFSSQHPKMSSCLNLWIHMAELEKWQTHHKKIIQGQDKNDAVTWHNVKIQSSVATLNQDLFQCQIFFCLVHFPWGSSNKDVSWRKGLSG